MGAAPKAAEAGMNTLLDAAMSSCVTIPLVFVIARYLVVAMMGEWE